MQYSHPIDGSQVHKAHEVLRANGLDDVQIEPRGLEVFLVHHDEEVLKNAAELIQQLPTQ